MYACLAVTCHLHFWQNDRDFLRATVVTRGWNGYRNKSQHRKSTLEKKILPPFQQGFEPATFQSRVRCSNHWAIPAPMFSVWEHSPYWTIIASDWLRAELSCGWRKNQNKNGWRCRSVLHSLWGEFVYLLTFGRRSLVSETQNEIVVSWITLRGMIKIYWLDFSLHFWSCCLLRVCRKFGLKLASHDKPVENEVKFGLSKPYSEN